VHNTKNLGSDPGRGVMVYWRGRIALVLCHLARGLLCAAPLLGAGTAGAEDLHRVGLRQVEFVDHERHLSLNVFYQVTREGGGEPFVMPLYTNLSLLRGAPLDLTGGRRPLVMFSHGRGSNGLVYAWFAEYLAARGYIVAAINHYRTNTYDADIAYLANKLWQRPIDIGLAISFLLRDETWGRAIDPERIGIAGHSQGGFTALWIGGAKVSAEKYLAFQNGWRNNRMVPEYLRRELPLDAGPALDVSDNRVKAAFAMAPGMVQAFGMDEAGLRQMSVPAYITVGARDTQTPPGPNAEFAAKNIPDAELAVIPGPVDHEIFVNECSEEGRDEFPEACIDAPGVDRAAIHKSVGDAAVRFFGKWLAANP
jgi:predicted dienelactone hydrolase